MVYITSEAIDHGEEEGGSLTIKPPQLQAQKHRDKSHKHKRDKHRVHENSSSKDRARLDSKSSLYLVTEQLMVLILLAIFKIYLYTDNTSCYNFSK